MNSRRLFQRVAFLIGILTAMVLTMPVMIADQPVTFSGQATVVRATVLGTPIVLSDTGPLPPSGGALEASLLTASVDGITVEVAHATTIGQGDRSRSEASVANLNLALPGNNNIAADFLMARATAVCGPGGASASGSSEIAGLVVNGQAITVSGQPNQTITTPDNLVTVIINEQTSSRAGDITVNALHVIVTVPGIIDPVVADVIISSAHADVTCHGTPSCTGGDFVTGGGWITLPSGAKGTFGVAGGIKNGSFWGHLTYIDHGMGMRVKGTGVTAYTVTGPTSRHIEGTCEINGQGGFTYQVDVADNGEPGRNDTFAISLSNGYTASGTLAGGNIQLHKPCQ